MLALRGSFDEGHLPIALDDDALNAVERLALHAGPQARLEIFPAQHRALHGALIDSSRAQQIDSMPAEHTVDGGEETGQPPDGSMERD